MQSLDLLARSIEGIFPKDPLNQEGMDEVKNLLAIEWGVNREHLLYKTGNIENDGLYDYQKYKIIWSFE